MNYKCLIMLNSVDELIIIVLFVFILNRTLWNVNNWPIGCIYLYYIHNVHSSILYSTIQYYHTSGADPDQDNRGGDF